MPNYNPNAPGILGNEWFPTVGSTAPVAEGQPVHVQRIANTATGTIGALRMAIESDPSVTDPLFTLVDIVAPGSEKPSVLTVEYAPNADETIGSWVNSALTGVNLFSYIDDAVVWPPPGTDFIVNPGGLSAYRCSVASGAFSLTARVCRLVVRAIIGLTALPGTQRTFTFSLYHEPTATVYQPSNASFKSNGLAPNPVEVNMGEINPVTLLPWSPADVRSFDAGDWHLRVTADGTGGTGDPLVHAMSLQVYYVATENRSAVATWQRPAGALARVVQTDALVSLSAGAWVANWSKPSTGAHLYMWRRAIGRLFNPSSVVASDIAWLTAYQDLGPLGNPAGISYPPVSGMTSDQLAFDANGLPTELFDGSSRRAARIILRTTAPADHVDSQVYHVRFDGTVLRSLSSTQSVGQLFTPGSSLSYLGVKAVVIPPTSGNPTLTIRIINAATGVQVGGTYTITAEAVRALPTVPGTLFRYVEGFLSTAAALTSGTQYEAQLQSSTSSDPWTVSLPDTDGNGTQSFGGTTGAARLNGPGGTTLTGQDAMVAVLVQPSALTNFRAVVRENPFESGASLCSANTIEQVTISWTASTLAGAWLRYEIERLGDLPDDVWEPVHQVTSSEAETSWTDREARRGRRVKYRGRVIATSTAFSDWAVSDWVEPLPTDAALIFTTNQDPQLEVAVDWEPHKEGDFPDHDADVEVPIYGRNGVVTFREPEDRGMRWSARLIVQAIYAPCDDYGRPFPDDRVWEPLRRITRASLPYVCVLDHRGNRTYASVRLSNASVVYDQDDEIRLYQCDAVITPASPGTPAVSTS